MRDTFNSKEEGYRFGNASEDFVIRFLNQKNGFCPSQGLTALANNRGSNKWNIDIKLIHNSTRRHFKYIEVKANAPFQNEKDCNIIYSFHSGDRINQFQYALESNGNRSWYAYLDIAKGNLMLMTDQTQLNKMTNINDFDQTLYGNRYDEKFGRPCRYFISDLKNDFMYLKTLKSNFEIWQYIFDVRKELKSAPELQEWLHDYSFKY